jgi:ubiquinone/menaquinone biosynthesis C-methylase UbiE
LEIDVKAYQTHWHPEEICEDFPETPDTSFIFFAWDRLVGLSASPSQPGRVLDVACGNARDILSLSDLGWEGWGLDASLLQLRDAREAAEKAGQRINLVRGVAEWLPFKQGVFDSLICKSALDHFVDHDRAMRGFAQVLRPKGRAVVSINNYKSIGTRSSRLLYRVLRAVWPPARKKRFFWDSPVPFQHTREFTLENSRELGEPYFDEVDCYGVSFFWGFPGWGRVLSVLPDGVSRTMLRALNKVARRLPRWADIVVLVWRPKESVKQSEAG